MRTVVEATVTTAIAAALIVGLIGYFTWEASPSGLSLFGTTLLATVAGGFAGSILGVLMGLFQVTYEKMRGKRS